MPDNAIVRMLLAELGEPIMTSTLLLPGSDAPMSDPQEIKQRLEQGGIPCMVESGRMAAVAGAGAAYTVTVPAERVDEARQILGG